MIASRVQGALIRGEDVVKQKTHVVETALAESSLVSAVISAKLITRNTIVVVLVLTIEPIRVES